MPASACGLGGLKPTRARNPTRPRRTAFSYPFTVPHVLTRSVRDTALLLDVTAGAAAAVETAKLLEELGHHVVEATPDHPADALLAAGAVGMSAPKVPLIDGRLTELGRALEDDDLEPFTRVLYDMGKALTGANVIAAFEELERAAHAIGALFVDHDLRLTPTMARPTPELGWLDTTDVNAMYERAGGFAGLTSPFNATGQPAISLPLGREDLLIRVASQLEQARPWDTSPVRPPG